MDVPWPGPHLKSVVALTARLNTTSLASGECPGCPFLPLWDPPVSTFAMQVTLCRRAAARCERQSEDIFHASRATRSPHPCLFSLARF
ncbi:hypothetical protein C8Q74DRAFT_944626 [Fomes fomentarius]|nr:hypothetical protein C8Q74DRAFT_944626 [Fomes fomentarius]